MHIVGQNKSAAVASGLNSIEEILADIAAVEEHAAGGDGAGAPE